jgi:hypothetical protein
MALALLADSKGDQLPARENVRQRLRELTAP